MTIPDKATAEGMRRRIIAQRTREGMTGPHPYYALDFEREEDRRIIASVYASMALDAIYPRERDCYDNRF